MGLWQKGILKREKNIKDTFFIVFNLFIDFNHIIQSIKSDRLGKKCRSRSEE